MQYKKKQSPLTYYKAIENGDVEIKRQLREEYQKRPCVLNP